MELEGIEEIPAQKVRVAMFKVDETYIELLEATSNESVIYKFIEKRGEGVHHIALGVEDVAKATKELAGKGARVVYEEAQDVGPRVINFIHPKSTHGVLLELVKRK